MDVLDLLPGDLELDGYELNHIGETNSIYEVRGRYQDKPLTAYLKVSKNSSHNLTNEYAVLLALASSGIPVPGILWASEKRNMLLLEAMDGVMVWDMIDPRRKHYRTKNAVAVIRQYGEFLGRIHRISLEWPPQPRTRLYGLIGEEQITDIRFQTLITWLASHEIAQQDQVFVHGDYNTANVLFRDGTVSGIVDWEYAGSGWKEYELAWVLRARMAFLNTPPERDAFLEGYVQFNNFDPHALRWCEVLNYLHDAYWSREKNPASTDFSLAQALALIQ